MLFFKLYKYFYKHLYYKYLYYKYLYYKYLFFLFCHIITDLPYQTIIFPLMIFFVLYRCAYTYDISTRVF